jgi:hypothetical protein
MTLIRIRGDTAANWASVNPTLAYKELASELDTQRLKIGDGATLWNALAFVGGAMVQASEAITAGNLCNVWTSGGAVRVRKANATDITKPANAFATAAAASGANASLLFLGQIIYGLSSLTPGAVYFLDTTGGALTTTAPSGSGNGVQEVGFALSATTLLFHPKSMIGL